MPIINGKEISREILAEAMRCESPEELVKLGKERGIELTAEEAEAYLAEIEEVELDSETLDKVAGGSSWIGGGGPCSQKCNMG